MVTRIRDKGQVTIPADIREALHLGKDAMLSVVKVGDGILLVPKASLFESVSAGFSNTAKKQGITLGELLKDLKTIRRKAS